MNRAFDQAIEINGLELSNKIFSETKKSLLSIKHLIYGLECHERLDMSNPL